MKVLKIPITEIDVLISRGRNEETHQLQADHIKKFGLIHPIKVALNRDKNGKKYKLVYGQGRLESAKRLEFKEIDAILNEQLSPVEHIEQWFTENNSRMALSPYDAGRILAEERDAGASLQKLSDKYKLSCGYISLAIKVIKKGSPKLKSKISKQAKYKRKEKENELRMNNAGEIVSAFDDHASQDTIVDTIEKLNVSSAKDIREIIKVGKKIKKEEGQIASTDDLIRSIKSIEVDLKKSSEEHLALFNQQDVLRKVFKVLCNDDFFMRLVEENSISVRF